MLSGVLHAHDPGQYTLSTCFPVHASQPIRHIVVVLDRLGRLYLGDEGSKKD